MGSDRSQIPQSVRTGGKVVFRTDGGGLEEEGGRRQRRGRMVVRKRVKGE